jgi:hypothetical protein
VTLQYSKVRAIGSSLTIQENASIKQDNAFLPTSIHDRMVALGINTITVTSVGTASSQGGFIQPIPGESVKQFLHATGTPEEVAKVEESHTGRFLREVLSAEHRTSNIQLRSEDEWSARVAEDAPSYGTRAAKHANAIRIQA